MPCFFEVWAFFCNFAFVFSLINDKFGAIIVISLYAANHFADDCITSNNDTECKTTPTSKTISWKRLPTRKVKKLQLSTEIDGASTSKLIICQGNSTSQVAAIADSVRDSLLEKCRIKPLNYEGYRNCQWIIIDYGDIMVHVFLPDFRTFYNLESLWNDAPIELIPDLD